MLASPSLSEQSAPVATAQTLNTVGAKQSLDQLETQIKALRQQATSTQNGIQQLAEQDAGSGHNGWLPDDPWMMGAVGLVLVLGALLVGWLLGRLTSRRRVLNAPVPAQNGFADSQMYLQAAAPIQMPPVRDIRSDLPVDPTPDHASAPLPLAFHHMDFQQSALLLESESAFGLFLDDAHPPGLATATPASLLQAEVDARVFVPPVEVDGFDHAAAANEVERVRKSLAQKRDARARQRAQDASVDFSWLLMDQPSSEPLLAVKEQSAHAVLHEDVHEAVSEDEEPSGGVDLLLDLPDECDLALEAPEIVEPDELTLELHRAESEMPVAEKPLMAQDVPLTLVPFDPPVETEAPQSDAAVRLALALEFETLGLLDGAHEIAQEVLASSDDGLWLKAEALMARLDEQETAQHVNALGDDVLPLRS